MENLTIFRIFLTFPLIGLIIPDVGIIFSNSVSNIPAGHLIIEITLLVSIIVCSYGIAYIKRKQNDMDNIISA